jgi:hypothetical protein
MLPLSLSDSRLGFHSEAEAHQFHPAKLEWRIKELDRTLDEISMIENELKNGRVYPYSEHEKRSAKLVCGNWFETSREFKMVSWKDRELDEHQSGSWVPSSRKFRFRPEFDNEGDLILDCEIPDGDSIELRTIDACGVSWPKTLVLHRNGRAETEVFNVVTPEHDVRNYKVSSLADGKGWRFSLKLGAGAWGFDSARRPAWICFRRGSIPIWPEAEPSKEYRLNIGNIVPTMFARIVEDEFSK